MNNPTRRNRNIGTSAQGHGQNNRLRIPDPYGTISLHWERVGKAKRATRMIWGRTISFYVQPMRADCVHACTVDDIARVLSLVPRTDCQGLDVIVLRQPTRKEDLLADVWGRLAYAADLVDEHGAVVYQGPAVLLEAVCPSRPIPFGKRLSVDASDELERLVLDGHRIRRDDRWHTVECTLASCRTTQLFRTVPHEIGHWVDYLDHVERPHSRAPYPDDDDDTDRSMRYHSRSRRDKEAAANRYADQLRRRLMTEGAIPFDRILDSAQLAADGLSLDDFEIRDVATHHQSSDQAQPPADRQ